MLQILESLEQTSFLTWVREAPTVWAYPTVLALHAFGMALLVGLSAMIALRVLGFAPGLPLAPLNRFFRLIWVGFWVNAVSGLLLFGQSATGFSTNVLFYIKMITVACAVVSIKMLRKEAFREAGSPNKGPIGTKAKVLAGASLILWGAAILVGRLTAYDIYTGAQTGLAVLILMLVLLAARYVGSRLLGLFKPSHDARATTTNY